MTTLNQPPGPATPGPEKAEPKRLSALRRISNVLYFIFGFLLIGYSAPIIGSKIAVAITSYLSSQAPADGFYIADDEKKAFVLIKTIEVCSSAGLTACERDLRRGHDLVSHLRHQLRKDVLVVKPITTSDNTFSARLDSMAYNLVTSAKYCTVRMQKALLEREKTYSKNNFQALQNNTSAPADANAHLSNPALLDLFGAPDSIDNCKFARAVIERFIKVPSLMNANSFREAELTTGNLISVYLRIEDSLSLPESLRWTDTALNTVQRFAETLRDAAICNGLKNEDRCRENLTDLHEDSVKLRNMALEAHAKSPPHHNYPELVVVESASIPKFIITTILFCLGSGSILFGIRQALGDYTRSNFSP